MVLIPKKYCRGFRLAFLVSALTCFSFVQPSAGAIWQSQPAQYLQQLSTFIFSSPAVVSLVYWQEAQIESPQEQAEADVTSGLPLVYALYGLLLSISLFAIYRWRDKSTRSKTRKAEIQASKKKQEIGAVARKFQQRLPENRIVRDRMAGAAPRIRSKPAEAFTASPFSTQRHTNSNPKVLIIDESRELRTALANQLHRYYSMLESGDLNEALRIARIARPALVILGAQSSKKEAIAFCRK